MNVYDQTKTEPQVLTLPSQVFLMLRENGL